MELVIETQKLKDALPYLSKYIGKAKKAQSTYIGLQFYIKDNELTFIGFDGTSGIRYLMGPVSINELSVTIEFGVFEQVIQYTEAKEVKFKFEDGIAKLSCGKSKYTFKYLNMAYEDCFSYEISGEPFMQQTVSQMCRMYKYMQSYICQNDNMPFLRGIYYDGNFCTTDSSTIGIYPFSALMKKGYMFPKTLYDRLVSFPNKDLTFDFYESGNSVLYKTEGIACFTQLLNGKFPNYKKVLEESLRNTYYVSIGRTEMLNACERLSPFNDPKDLQKVTVSIAPDVLTLTTSTAEKDREGLEEITIKQTNVDKGFCFRLNLKKLLLILNTALQEDIKIIFDEATKMPIKFETDTQACVFDSVIQTRMS